MEIQYILELFGTFFFAMSGALAVSEKDQEQDWFGAGFTGFVTAIGGGSLRDMLLGSYPLVWVQDIRLIYAVIWGIVCTGVFFNWLLRLRRTFLLFDTLGMSLFTIVGTEKALRLGVQPEIAALMGMFTAVMGGVIRDTLLNETPVLFRKEIYASVSLLGATCYIVLSNIGLERNTNFLLTSALIVVIRLVAVKYKLSLPLLNKARKT